MNRHYGTRSSSSAPLTDEEWGAICAFATEECRRIKPKNPSAYRATVIARKMEEVIDNRALGHAVDKIIAAEVEAVRLEPVVYVAPLDAHRAAVLMRQGIEDGRRERAELLAKMEAEQGKDPSWVP